LYIAIGHYSCDHLPAEWHKQYYVFKYLKIRFEYILNNGKTKKLNLNKFIIKKQKYLLLQEEILTGELPCICFMSVYICVKAGQMKQTRALVLWHVPKYNMELRFFFIF